MIVTAHCPCGIGEYISMNCPRVSIVIEGKCDKLYFNGDDSPDNTDEQIQTQYPLVVEGYFKGLKIKSVVVGSFMYEKYLGKLFIKFHENSNEFDYFGNSYLIDDRFEKDPEIENLTKSVPQYLDDFFYIEHRIKFEDNCETKTKCILGQTMAKYLILARDFSIKDKYSSNLWNEAYIVVIRSNFLINSKQKLYKFNLKVLMTVMYLEEFLVIQVRGSTLKTNLEFVAKQYFEKRTVLFHIYGLQGQVDAQGQETYIEVLVGNQDAIEYVELDEDAFYNIIIDTELYNGLFALKEISFTEANVYAPKKITLNSNEVFKEFMLNSFFVYSVLEEELDFVYSKAKQLANNFTTVLLIFELRYCLIFIFNLNNIKM